MIYPRLLVPIALLTVLVSGAAGGTAVSRCATLVPAEGPPWVEARRSGQARDRLG